MFFANRLDFGRPKQLLGIKQLHELDKVKLLWHTGVIVRPCLIVHCNSNPHQTERPYGLPTPAQTTTQTIVCLFQVCTGHVFKDVGVEAWAHRSLQGHVPVWTLVLKTRASLSTPGPSLALRGIAGAMVVVEGTEGVAQCPVMTEWLNMEEVVKRGTKGHIALCTTESLTRSTVADNHELLIPLIKHFGTLSAKKMTLQENPSCICRLILTPPPSPRYASIPGQLGRPDWKISLLLPTSW